MHMISLYSDEFTMWLANKKAENLWTRSVSATNIPVEWLQIYCWDWTLSAGTHKRELWIYLLTIFFCLVFRIFGFNEFYVHGNHLYIINDWFMKKILINFCCNTSLWQCQSHTKLESYTFEWVVPYHFW